MSRRQADRTRARWARELVGLNGLGQARTLPDVLDRLELIEDTLGAATHPALERAVRAEVGVQLEKIRRLTSRRAA